MITCRLHRNAILRAADTSTPPSPAAAAEHLRQCPACRQLHESHVSIAQCLIAGAPSRRREPSPFLHARIMRTIERSEMETRPARAFRWIPATALAVCVVLTGIVLIQNQPGTQPPSPVRPQPTRGGDGLRLVLEPVIPKNLKLPSETQVREWTGKIDQPLQTEMELVVSDARSAVNSLDNLIPPNVRAKLVELAGN